MRSSCPTSAQFTFSDCSCIWLADQKLLPIRGLHAFTLLWRLREFNSVNMGSSMAAELRAATLHQVRLIHWSNLSTLSTPSIYHLLTHIGYGLCLLCSTAPPVISFHLLHCSKREFAHIHRGTSTKHCDYVWIKNKTFWCRNKLSDILPFSQKKKRVDRITSQCPQQCILLVLNLLPG